VVYLYLVRPHLDEASVTAPDLFYVALIAVALLWDYFVLWPAFLRRSPTEPSRARVFLWSGWMIMLWTLVAVGVALWLFEARPWPTLKFVIPQGWRFWGSIGLVLVLAITQARTIIRIARSKRLKRIKMGNPHAEKISPHTRSEVPWWIAVSLSAGFCEEFIFRGYLIWAFQPVFGLWGSAAFSLVVFALAHVYQGAKGIFGVGAIGLLFTLVVLISGSLWPAIALHALTDIGQGLLAWVVFRSVGEGSMVAA
jgi:membrane protease YdiL (CAAX protease family)